MSGAPSRATAYCTAPSPVKRNYTQRCLSGEDTSVGLQPMRSAARMGKRTIRFMVVTVILLFRRRCSVGLLGARMRGVIDAFDLLESGMRIDLRGAERGVSEEFLDSANISTIV